MSKVLMFVGGRNGSLPETKLRNGKGIAAYRIDTGTGAAQLLGVADDVDDPTFVTVSPDGRWLAAVSEYPDNLEGQLSAYAIDPATGGLQLINRVPSGGATTAHLSYDATGRFVAAINYHAVALPADAGVSVVVLRCGADGRLGERTGVATHSGTGPDASRQDRSHAHCVRWTPDNRFLVVADLGIDRLVVYRFDAATGAIARHGELALPPGSGPRHFAFHPDGQSAYVINELNSTLASLSYDAASGRLGWLGVAPTLPPGATGINYCSAIQFAPGGTELFGGNRGHESVARFSIGDDRVARFAGTVPSGGNWPRDFAFDPTGAVLAVANQESDRVTLFAHRQGELTRLGDIESSAPNGVVFHPHAR